MHLYVPVFLRLICLLRGINNAISTMTECLHKKPSALLQYYLSRGCQLLNHHTFSSANTGLYRSFLTNLLYLLLCGLCFLVPAPTSAHCFSPCPSP